jgi:hypothetical protein
MDRRAPLILLVLIIGCSKLASADNLMAAMELSQFGVSDPAIERRAAEDQESQESKTSTPLAQEESEDDDDSANEKVFHKLSLKTFSHFLELLYSQQHSIFESLNLEIETPPPQNS